jgi:prefoldin subunit 5
MLNEEKEDYLNQIMALQSQVAELSSLRDENMELKRKLNTVESAGK